MWYCDVSWYMHVCVCVWGMRKGFEWYNSVGMLCWWIPTTGSLRWLNFYRYFRNVVTVTVSLCFATHTHTHTLIHSHALYMCMYMHTLSPAEIDNYNQWILWLHAVFKVSISANHINVICTVLRALIPFYPKHTLINVSLNNRMLCHYH